ncbi:hypothetical protein RSAG8_12618, partial [Rhizoctonia solani AG-8 WAC10335]
MSISTDLAVLEHLAYSVFLPPKLPQAEQERAFQQSVDLAIIRSVIQACQDYPARSEANSLSLYIRAQNAGVIIRKHDNNTIFEAFEAQAQIKDVMSVPGKISRLFPGPAVNVPNSVANDNDFVEEVARILAEMNTKVLDQARPGAERTSGNLNESHDSINPNYFVQYFLGFLRGVGTTIDPPRIAKRLADEVLSMNTGKPWRRSPLWLITRIALQTSLDSTIAYKHFMVYYHASILSQCHQHDGFVSDLLYAMRIKMARRLYKLQETAPQFLVDAIKEAAEGTQDILQGRWSEVQSAKVQCSNHIFSDCDFESAINQTLPKARGYLQQVFEGRSCHSNPAGFTPAHSPRLQNIVEFTQYSNEALSRSFSSDPHLALYDFEASVFDNLSYWVSRRQGFFGACATIASCFQQYITAAKSYYKVDIANQSIMMLTLMRLWMAIDDYPARSEASIQWSRIELMLQRLYEYAEIPFKQAQLCDGMKNMRPKGESNTFGNSLSLYIRAQNAGVIIRKHDNNTIFEAFEAQAQIKDVMSVPGKISRLFPGPALNVPNSVANDNDFVEEVARILAEMNTKVLDQARPGAERTSGNLNESHNSINPNYFVQYFLGFLRGVGTTIDPPRIVKRLADECHRHNGFASDLLYAMRVKMARRLYKLQEMAPQFLVDTIREVAEGTQDILQERWSEVQSAQAQCSTQIFSDCDFESAINQTLPNARSYLQQVFEGRSCHSNPAGFTLAHSPRLQNIVEFTQYSNEALSRSFSSDPHLALYDFEASVFDDLSYWVSRRQGFFGACATIASCFQQYLTAAKSYYKVDIANQSIMMLTLMRLWMAIDELATSECPLLLEFSPEVPDDILDRLLLRTAQHLKQARIIQQYIRERRTRITPNNPTIFLNGATESSFAVKYFRSSPRHQQLKLDIEKHAQEQRDQKIQELEELNAQSKQLGRESQDMVHQYYEAAQADQVGQTESTDRIGHYKFCGRCLKEKERRGIQIQRHEWPLPPGQLDAEAVVFELHCPESFTIWRDITYTILVDLGTEYKRGNHYHSATLDKYSALVPWLSTPTGITPRIVMASSTGSFNELCHNTAADIPALVGQVCPDNPLHFSLYDKTKSTWASGPFPNVTFAKYGALEIPKNSAYHHLEYTLKGTTHTSNEVLADQYGCPEELSLHEHIAFGTLRSGACLQWINIVRGLEEDLLTFSSDEVRLLHTQAAWEIGPLSLDLNLSSLGQGMLLLQRLATLAGENHQPVLSPLIVVGRGHQRDKRSQLKFIFGGVLLVGQRAGRKNGSGGIDETRRRFRVLKAREELDEAGEGPVLGMGVNR